jgi:hypothetical protein
VELSAGLQGLKVINSIRVPIAAPNKEEGKNSVLDALREAVSKAKIGNSPVVAAIPSQDALIRYFRMPGLPAQERHKAIVFEAKKYIPFKLEEIVSGYSIAELSKKGDSESMGLVFGAIKKDVLSQYASYISQAGIKVKTVEPAALSLLRWYKFNGLGDSGKSVALLELESNSPSVTLTIVKKDIPYFVREIGLPKPLVLDKQADISKSDMFERLLSEVHISFEYYRKWFQGEKVEKMVVFSQVEVSSSLAESLGKEIDIPVEVGMLRKGIKTRGYLSSELYLATGAALSDTVKSKVSLNLYRSPKIGWFEGKAGIKKAVIFEVASALLLAAIFYFIASGPVKINQARLSGIISSRPKLEDTGIDINSFAALKDAKNILLKKQAAISGLLKNKLYWTPRLVGLVNSVPEGVWLTDVELSREIGDNSSSPQHDLLIKAKALLDADGSGEDVSNKFLESLKKDRYFSGIFKNIYVTYLNTEDVNGRKLSTFSIGSEQADSRPASRRR